MSRTEIVLVDLSNGDSAVFLNARIFYAFNNAKAAKAKHPAVLARSLADSLGAELEHVQLETPDSESWNWDDVYQRLALAP